MALGSRSARPTADVVLPTRTEAAVTAGDRLTTSVSRSPARANLGRNRHLEGHGSRRHATERSNFTTAAEKITIACGAVIPWLRECAVPEKACAVSDLHLPGHRDVERGAAAVRRRIDLPVDGLRNVGKPAIWRLTVLRLTGLEILATTRLPHHLKGGRTTPGRFADGAVPISREGSLAARPHVAGLDHERGNRRRDTIVPGSTNLEADVRTLPADIYSAPMLKLKPEV